MNMKKNMVALTVMLALSAHAQADDLKPSDHNLKITGSVVVDGCAFEDGTADNQQLLLTLNEVSVSTVLQNPTSILNSLDSSSKNTLVCPAGIDTVVLSMAPNAGTFTGQILNNIATNDAASGIGFKVAAAFGEDLPVDPNWINFDMPEQLQAQPGQDGKIAVNFGANYVLTSTMDKASAGNVEANLPFTITYL